MHKVKAHADEAFLRGQVSILDYLGNLVADAAAGIIADEEVNTILDENVSQWTGIAFQVANRISLLEKEAWGKDPKEVLMEDDIDEPEITIREHINDIIANVGQMDHELITRGRYVTCTKCAPGVTTKDIKGQVRAKA